MPSSFRAGRRRGTSALLAIGLASVLVWLLGRGTRASGEGGPGLCLDYETPGACPDEPTIPGLAAPSPAPSPATILEASQVCAAAGYLCSGLEQRGELRVLRWNDATPEIQIRIPRPRRESSSDALRLQQAAARGIAVWNGHPFPLRVLLSDRPGQEDIAVRWTEASGGLELGRVQTRWIRETGSATLEIDEFALSTRNPHNPGRTLDPSQVTLTAAHEMGHALGLPHSDAERDVMYPTNTARALSSRDFRTMEALYSLENGAELRFGG